MNASTNLAPVVPGPIRVLEVVGNAIVGGMETFVERLIEHLPRDRFAVSVLCPFEGDYAARLRALDVDVLIVPMAHEPLWSSIHMLCSLVRTRAIDVLHAHMTNAHGLAAIVGRLTDTPVLTTIHTREVTMLDLEIHRTTGTHVAVLCHQSYFHALGVGVNAARLDCIPNGVDTRVFQPNSAVSADTGAATTGLRADFAIAPGAPLIGFVGRLSPEKGPDAFLRAALLLRDTPSRPHFVLVGDGPMRGWLDTLVRRYGLGDCVHFAGTRFDMPQLYRQFDFLVSSSHSEAMPLAVMEAMASGLPVIATRVGGVPDLIAEGRTGWVVEPGNFEAIAARAAELLDSPELARRMGIAARQRAVDHFELSGSAMRTGELLARLAALRPDTRRLSAQAPEMSRKLALAPGAGADLQAGFGSHQSA